MELEWDEDKRQRTARERHLDFADVASIDPASLVTQRDTRRDYGELRFSSFAYLRGREQVTMVYLETWRRIWLDDDPRQNAQALCYIVDRGHEQYAGRLSAAEQLHYCRQGHGRSGACRDYVLATVKELETLGVRDAGLHQLAVQLKGAHEASV